MVKSKKNISQSSKYTKGTKTRKAGSKTSSYRKVFTNPDKFNIVFLKKREFDIFYSYKYKYPLLVKETVNAQTGNTDPREPPIDRRVIDDPFRLDPTIPAKYQFTVEDYTKFMEYGGSMGHNAPAGQHKTNMQVYSETFLMTNMAPQEIVFNSGLWAIIENWTKMMGRNKQIKNVIVFTGSIVNSKYNYLDGLYMNIPTKMFKIIAFESTTPGDSNIYMDIIMADNKAFYVKLKDNKINLNNYVVSKKNYKYFETTSGINIKKLLAFYGYNIIEDFDYKKSKLNVKSYDKSYSKLHGTSIEFVNNIVDARTIIGMDFKLSPGLVKLMKKSTWFGKLIYSKSMTELDEKWNELQNYEAEFETLEFHKEYYDLCKKLLLREMK